MPDNDAVLLELDCRRMRGHDGPCGEPADDDEADDVLLFGRCGASDRPVGVIHA